MEMSIYGILLHQFSEKKYSAFNQMEIMRAIANLPTREQIDKATLLATEIIRSEVPEEEATRRILHQIAALNELCEEMSTVSPEKASEKDEQRLPKGNQCHRPVTGSPLTNGLKAVLWNFLGIILALIGGELVEVIARWLFLSVLPEIPLITSLLSWPVDYSVYALTSVVTVNILASVGIAAFFGKSGGTHINFAVVIISLINAIRYISGFITGISNFGFSLELLIVYVVAFGTIIFSFISNVSDD